MRLPLPLPPAHAKRFDVVGFGQNSVDLVVALEETLTPDTHIRASGMVRLPGGEVATATVACARLGCRTRYIGSVGSDEEGALVRATLAGEGVDLTYLRQADAANRSAVILVEPDGRRSVIWRRDPRLTLAPSLLEPAAITDGRLLLLDASDPPAALAAARIARAAGIPSVLDIDLVAPESEELLRAVDVIIAGATCLKASTGETTPGAVVRHLTTTFQPALTVVTLGGEGSLAFISGEEIHTPAYRVDVRDSTGAGDAFRGGFAASWLRYGDGACLGIVLKHATAIAALNCQALGAQEGLPTWSAVDVLVTG